MLQIGRPLPDVPLTALDGRAIRAPELGGGRALGIVFFRGAW